MIAYDLKCSEGHIFEGWFDDEAALLSQQQEGLVVCPICNADTVVRIPSTFAIRPRNASPSDKSSPEDIGREIAAFIEDRFDNVGSDFAKEALKIHYGVTEPRNIRGSSTPQEEKTLRDEGVAFLKIPVPAPPESDA